MLFAAALAAALPAGARAAPPVLIADRDAIFARYVDPALDSAQAQARKDVLAAEIAAEARRQAPDAIVFDKPAMLMFRPSSDITAFIEAVLDKTDKPVDAAAPLPEIAHAVHAMPIRPFVLDQAGLIRGVPSPSRDALAKRVNALLWTIMLKDKATFVLDRAAVVLGLVDCDITEKLVTRLNGGTAAIAAPDSKPAGMVFLNRARILAESKAGLSIVAQVNALSAAADTEFQAESDSLHADGEALQARLSSLTPKQQSEQTAAFEARNDAFQAKVKARQSGIDNAVLDARHAVEAKLERVLVELMQQRGAVLLVDTKAAVAFPDGLDITGEAIASLDRVMPDFELQLQDGPN